MTSPVIIENASDLVYKQLIAMIISGDWGVDFKIPTEKELAERFGVSRAPVREALQRLHAIGIIKSRQGYGTYISDIDIQDVLNVMVTVMEIQQQDLSDLLEYRMQIEPYCAAVVACNTEKIDLQTITQYAPDPSRQKLRVRDIYSLDIDFHRSIVEAVNNSVFCTIQKLTANFMKRQVDYFMRLRVDHERIAEEHYNIGKAICEGNAEEAEKLMYDHILYVKHLL